MNSVKLKFAFLRHPAAFDPTLKESKRVFHPFPQVLFKLAKPGLMKAFEGKWSVSPCDMSQPLAVIMAERDAKDASEMQHWSKRLSASQSVPGSTMRPLPPWAHATALANNFKGQ